MKRAIAVSLALAVPGCSFAFVNGPPANHQQLPMFDCTTSRVVPGLDTLWSILQVANLALATSDSDAEWDARFGGDPLLSRSTSIPVYAVLAAVGVAGMYYGFKKTGECRSAKNQLIIRATGGMQQPAPGTWPPPAQQQPPPPPPPAPYDAPAPPPAPAPY